MITKTAIYMKDPVEISNDGDLITITQHTEGYYFMGDESYPLIIFDVNDIDEIINTLESLKIYSNKKNR